jgi:hypothetical protein
MKPVGKSKAAKRGAGRLRSWAKTISRMRIAGKLLKRPKIKW